MAGKPHGAPTGRCVHGVSFFEALEAKWGSPKRDTQQVLSANSRGCVGQMILGLKIIGDEFAARWISDIGFDVRYETPSRYLQLPWFQKPLVGGEDPGMQARRPACERVHWRVRSRSIPEYSHAHVECLFEASC